MNNEAAEAFSLTTRKLYDKYTGNMLSAFEERLREAEENPCCEARLMNALKPFVSEARAARLDRAIEITHALNALAGPGSPFGFAALMLGLM